MPTMKDVAASMKDATLALAILSADSALIEEYRLKLVAVGKAIRKESGIDPESKGEMPGLETELGAESIKAFQDLNLWIDNKYEELTRT